MSRMDSTMTTPSNRARALVLLLITFAVGGVAGAAADRAWIRRTPPTPSARRPEPPRPGGRSEVDADRIPFPLEVLQLTPEETERLHAIARRWRPQASRAMDSIRANISELENNMFAEMLCVISKEKQDRYLAQLQENGASPALIDKRFRLVRSNQCGSVRREERRR